MVKATRPMCRAMMTGGAKTVVAGTVATEVLMELLVQHGAHTDFSLTPRMIHSAATNPWRPYLTETWLADSLLSLSTG
jgi:hypothetical protein